MKQPFRLKKRGKIFYYMLQSETCFHSTGCTRRREAEHYALERLREGPNSRTVPKFGDYTKDFFVMGRCQWIKTTLDKGRPFSKGTAHWRRGILLNHLLTKLADKKINEITANMIDTLLHSLDLSNTTKNNVLDTVSIILDMAIRDGLIQNNPTNIIVRFAKNPKTKDIFSREELKILFPDDIEALNCSGATDAFFADFGDGFVTCLKCF